MSTETPIETPIDLLIDAPIPVDTIRIEDESHDVETYLDENDTKQVVTEYALNTAPFERLVRVQATVDGVTQELAIGSDVVAGDPNGDGEPETIDLSVEPDIGSTIVVDYVTESTISRYTGAFDDDRLAFRNDVNQSIDNKQINNATGQELALNGDLFGDLGDRDRRSDTEYRAVLRSIVPAFNGRGTVEGLKFAIAVGTQTSVDKVNLIEDFGNVGFEVEVESTDQIITSGLNDLIQQAAPSGVELLSPPVVIIEGATVTASSSSFTSSRSRGLGAFTLDNATLE